MGVTQVIRGDDLVPSTPRQILLYRALGWARPDFGHVPLAVGPDGRRLAKRDGSIKLATLREAGRRPAPAGRLAGAVVRLDRPDRAVRPARLDRPVPDRRHPPLALGRDTRHGCRVGSGDPLNRGRLALSCTFRDSLNVMSPSE